MISVITRLCLLASPLPENPPDKCPVQLFITASRHIRTSGISVFPVSLCSTIQAGEAIEQKQDDHICFLQPAFIKQLGIIAINHPCIMGVHEIFSHAFLLLPAADHPIRQEMHCIKMQHIRPVKLAQLSCRRRFPRATVAHNCNLHDTLLSKETRSRCPDLFYSCSF